MSSQRFKLEPRRKHLAIEPFRDHQGEAFSDKHRACVVRKACSKKSITRSDFWASTKLTRMRLKRATGDLKRGGAEERSTRSSGDKIGPSIRSSVRRRHGVRLRSAEKLVESSQMRAAACDNACRHLAAGVELVFI